jgi:two-component system OmpR family response regulator
MNGSSSEAQLLGDTRVLVIGDDLGARRISRWNDLDYRTAEPEDALRWFYELRPEAVLVDCPVDSSTALELIDRLRVFSELPILALTETSEAGVHALYAGADAVVPKPVSRDELLLRLQRVLTRSGHVNAVLGDSLVELDRLNHRVIARGEQLDLSPTEFRLLAVLMEHPGAVLSQHQLLEMAWGDVFRGEAEVKLYVSYLRRKFARVGIDPIETVRGVGYRYRTRLLEAASAG